MEKRHINPWTWQDARNYVQAVEVKNATGTLYVSGQTAISDDGISSDADMRTQIGITLKNLEKVITQSDYDVKKHSAPEHFHDFARRVFRQFRLVPGLGFKKWNQDCHHLSASQRFV